jgi:hypothetical protein
MTARTVQLVLHYDGSAFAGWQRQPKERTVQGELERVLTRLTGSHVAALGAGRTDAGVHARGQAVGVRVPERWSAANLRRALNALLPRDIWVATSHDMRPEFHARYSALAIDPAQGICHAEAGRRQRLEAGRRQQFGGAGIPRVWQDQNSGPRMHFPEQAALLSLRAHFIPHCLLLPVQTVTTRKRWSSSLAI